MEKRNATTFFLFFIVNTFTLILSLSMFRYIFSWKGIYLIFYQPLAIKMIRLIHNLVGPELLINIHD